MDSGSAQEERELVAQAQAGDRAAFGELVRRHQLGVINVVYRMCGDVRLAEDATQEAFIRAWDHLGGYRPHSAFRNWVYRIAVNVARDALQREHASANVEDLELVSDDEGPDAAFERKEREECVRQAVLALPEASRAVIVLREYGGLSYREIASALDIPMGTVMSRLNYARHCLRGALAPYLESV